MEFFKSSLAPRWTSLWPRANLESVPLSFAFSTCPNDTFAFHALVHGLVPGPSIAPHMDDIEALSCARNRARRRRPKSRSLHICI